MNIFDGITFGAALFSVGIKATIVSMLFSLSLGTHTISRPLIILLGILVSSLFGDIAWGAKIIRTLLIHDLPYSLVVFLIRISWGFMIMQYQLLALFMNHLSKPNFKAGTIHYTFFTITALIFSYFFGIAFLGIPPTDAITRRLAFCEQFIHALPEVQIMRLTTFYVVTCFIIPGLYVAYQNIRNPDLPKVLQSQFSILAQFFILPYLAIELIQTLHLLAWGTPIPKIIVAISTSLCALASLYCFRQLLRLRFLNLSPSIRGISSHPAIDTFKEVLEQTTQATSIKELEQITQSFFKDSFKISVHNTQLYLRVTNRINQDQQASPTLLFKNIKHKEHIEQIEQIEQHVEQFIYQTDTATYQTVRNRRILLYEETKFSDFYQDDSNNKIILTFLNSINADIFLPIYLKKRVVAYIIVTRNARPHCYYGQTEHNQMLIFADYLGTIINIIQDKRTEALLKIQKTLDEQLTACEYIIQQYDESIRSFLPREKINNTGVLVYKNRHFHLKNTAARQLIDIDLNNQSGHELTRAARTLTTDIAVYQSPQQIIAHNNHGDQILLSGSPNLEGNSIIITASYPTITDTIGELPPHFRTQDKLHLGLYLKTTRAGKLINQFLPGMHDTLMEHKIALLRHALSKQALLIWAHPEDASAITQLMHTISKQETLKTIDPNALLDQEPINQIHHTDPVGHTGRMVFGIHPKINVQNNINSKPLLERLSDNGTLHINNIDFTDSITQEHLAEYIETGYFRHIKGDSSEKSNTRIICTITENPRTLVSNGTLSQRLYQALQEQIIIVPPPSELPREAFNQLADSFSEQIIQSNTLQKLLCLTDQEKERLARSNPSSFYLLKERIRQLILEKSKKSNFDFEPHIEPTYETNDPALIEAIRLGKHALRDAKMVRILWHQFKNQNKIATLLGVNRSSVNRRIKEYGLHE